MTTAVRVSPLRPTIEVMVMRIVTRCTTVEEFIVAFRALCTERTLFIPSAQARATGIETGFSLRLADGTPMLRGLCVVLASWPTADNPYRRPGVRLGIRSLTAESRHLLHRILRARGAPTVDLRGDTIKTAVPSPHPTAVPRPIAPRYDDTQPTLVDARSPADEGVLPANPLSEMTDESLASFVECTIHESLHDDN